MGRQGIQHLEQPDAEDGGLPELSQRLPELVALDLLQHQLANLANGAVTVTVGETNVFVAATAAQTMRPGQDFFPLTVDYREKYSAAGRFPEETSSP